MSVHEPSGSFCFEILRRDSSTHARVGKLHTPHGVVDTPAYMPVGTHGAVRALTPDQVAGTGSQIVLANTYHLHLRPGEDLVREAGGLHRFMAWDGPILTDSGGFQVFSLAHANRLDEDGVSFRSHIDGAEVRLTPEKAVEIQNALGADIIMAFDHCPSLPASREEVERAVDRTTRWASRCLRAHARPDSQALFGIVQGGTHLDLRRRSLDGLASLDFPGYAIGGVSVGEPNDEIRRVIAEVGPWLPEDRPRYLMGIGTAEDILAGIAAGVDLFDCVMATRSARNASLFTREGPIKVRNQQYEGDLGPLDPRSDESAIESIRRQASTANSSSGSTTTCAPIVRARLRRFSEKSAATIGSTWRRASEAMVDRPTGPQPRTTAGFPAWIADWLTVWSPTAMGSVSAACRMSRPFGTGRHAPSVSTMRSP